MTVLKDSLLLVPELSGSYLRRTVNARLVKPVKDRESFLRFNPVFRQEIEKIKDHNNINESKGKEKKILEAKVTHS